MDLVQNIFKHIATKLNKLIVEYKNVKIDFAKPFKRVSMFDLVQTKTQIDFRTIKTDQEAIALAKEHHIELAPHQKTKGHILNAFFETFCEAECVQPTFVYDYPIEVSPLAKKNKENEMMTERFELFICGKEYANAFSELNDPIDQQQRFQNQLKERDLGNAEANEMD
jgi:lysyl-tRNA synthetase class 2